MSDLTCTNEEAAERIAKVGTVTKVQCTDGNWNHDEYMRGMANGLLIAMSILHDVNDPVLFSQLESE